MSATAALLLFARPNLPARFPDVSSCPRHSIALLVNCSTRVYSCHIVDLLSQLLLQQEVFFCKRNHSGQTKALMLESFFHARALFLRLYRFCFRASWSWGEKNQIMPLCFRQKHVPVHRPPPWPSTRECRRLPWR